MFKGIYNFLLDFMCKIVHNNTKKNCKHFDHLCFLFRTSMGSIISGIFFYIYLYKIIKMIERVITH